MGKVRFYITIVNLENGTVANLVRDNKADYLSTMEKEVGKLDEITHLPVEIDDSSVILTNVSSDKKKAFSVLVVPVNQ